MRTNTMSTVFKTTGIVMMGISAALLCILLVQDVLMGWGAFFDASNITYNSSDPAVVAEVRNVGGIQLLTLFVSEALLFITGLLAVLFAKKADRMVLCVAAAGTTLVSWVFAVLAHNRLAEVMWKYDIPSDAGDGLLIAVAVVLAFYATMALLNRRALKKNAAPDQTDGGGTEL